MVRTFKSIPHLEISSDSRSIWGRIACGLAPFPFLGAVAEIAVQILEIIQLSDRSSVLSAVNRRHHSPPTRTETTFTTLLKVLYRTSLRLGIVPHRAYGRACLLFRFHNKMRGVHQVCSRLAIFDHTDEFSRFTLQISARINDIVRKTQSWRWIL